MCVCVCARLDLRGTPPARHTDKLGSSRCCKKVDDFKDRDLTAVYFVACDFLDLPTRAKKSRCCKKSTIFKTAI